MFSVKCKYQKRSLIKLLKKSDKTHLKKLEKEEQIQLIFEDDNTVVVLKAAF